MGVPWTYEIRPARWEAVSHREWNDWHWQQQNRVRTLGAMGEIIELTEAERGAFRAGSERFRAAITPHYASLMAADDPRCPIRMQAVPQPEELERRDFERRDPLAEQSHMPVPGITHRYPDRVLFYVTHNCPVYCRHCTRKRKVSDPTTAASLSQIEAGLAYIRQTPRVRDVLVSGGDPLTLSDARLADILGQLRSIDHVEVIRLGTRNPVTLPQRITDGLCDVLRATGPIYVNTHFNHPSEVGADAVRALDKLVEAGCVVGNQMVLLKAINDDPDTVLALNRTLLEHGCRPYYMLQCDMAEGMTHFRTPLRTGFEIMDHLRGRIAGMGVPDFVVDLPGGGGKVELVPDYIVSRQPDDGGQMVTFRNWAGAEFEFFDVDGSSLA